MFNLPPQVSAAADDAAQSRAASAGPLDSKFAAWNSAHSERHTIGF
jgi:hypothetical protein